MRGELLDEREADVPVAPLLRELRRREAAPVVIHGEAHLTVVRAQRDLDVRGLGVDGDVAQRLARRPVEQRLGLGPQLDGLVD